MHIARHPGLFSFFKNSGRIFSAGFTRSFRIFFLLLLVIAGNEVNAQIQFNFNSNYKYLKGSAAGSLSAGWMTASFDDSGWSSGSAPFRYGDGSGGTLISDMPYNYSTLYLRTTFNAFSVDRIKTISFLVNYDDGFVIWINGVMVLSQNAPATLSNTSLATASYESGTVVTFDVDSANVPLVEGENLLCIQGLNVSLSSSDFYFDMGIKSDLSLPEVSDSLKIEFDHEAGFYNDPFALKMTSGNDGYKIVYTLDGSNPQTSSTAFTAGSLASVNVDPESTAGRAKTPAFIIRASLARNGFAPSKPVTRSFIFIDKVLTQSYPGGDWPSSSVNGQVIDLEMDPEIVGDPRFSASMKESLMDIPSISLVTDNANMFSASKGIYVNSYSHGEQWERECSVELINPDSSPGFQVNAGVRIRGGASREGSNPKHAFRLFFRKEYGPGKLDFPLFGDEGASEFDKIDLRTEQNYSWSKDGDTHNTFLRDIFSRDSQRDMSEPYTRGKYYHLYLNGMYWGLYQTDERPEADYASTYFGDDKEDYDVIKVSVEGWPYYNEATDGTMESWQDLWNRCTTGFVSNTSYFALEGKDQYGKPVKNTRVYVDIDNLIDYMLTIFYTGNVDAPVSAFYSNMMPNNYYAILNRKDKGKGFVFIAHDSEHSMFVNPIYVTSGLNENRVTINDPAMTATGIRDFQPQWLHDKLAKNSEYRQRFADRAYLRFAEGGALTPVECLKRFDARRQQVDMPVIAESARWGDSKTTVPRNKTDDWLPEINSIISNYIPFRSSIVISQLKAAGLYATVQPAIIKKAGIAVTGENVISSPVIITFENPNPTGIIYYTTDGNDPREVGGALSVSAIVAANNSTMSIAETTVIRSRVLSGQTWSPLKAVTFSSEVEDYSWLKVTEVNYNPVDYINGTDTIDSKDLEFIELKNTGINSVNISGVTIDSAVYCRVPDGVILPPKAFFVVASKPESFYEYYGMNASGNFKGNLSNGGEYILIYDKSGAPILSFTYSDNYPWPADADGHGKSLVAGACLPMGNPDNYKYWKNSLNKGGSPFADDGNSGTVDPSADDMLKNMTVYPNPTPETLYVNFVDLTSEQIKVKLTDISGRTVLIREVENNSGINLKRAGLRAGVYVVTAEYNGVRNSLLFVYQPTE
jgi:hypothetical protein